MRTAQATCGTCGSAAKAKAEFCQVCGAALVAETAPVRSSGETPTAPSRKDPLASAAEKASSTTSKPQRPPGEAHCSTCGTVVSDADPYCTNCGARQVPATGADVARPTPAAGHDNSAGRRAETSPAPGRVDAPERGPALTRNAPSAPIGLPKERSRSRLAVLLLVALVLVLGSMLIYQRMEAARVVVEVAELQEKSTGPQSAGRADELKAASDADTGEPSKSAPSVTGSGDSSAAAETLRPSATIPEPDSPGAAAASASSANGSGEGVPQPTPSQAKANKVAERKVAKEKAPTAAPVPAPVVEPAVEEAAPAIPPAAVAAPEDTRTTVEQFNEVNDLVVSIEQLSKQVLKAHEQDGREDDPIWAKLDAFVTAAKATRREFRKATGTGLGGMMSNVTSIVRRNRGGRDADSNVVRISVEDLVRRADEIDTLSAGAPLSATTMEYWRETRSNLVRLAELLGHG